MMHCRSLPAIAGFFACSFFAGTVSGAQQQQTLSNDGRAEISEMLRDARDEVKKHYYDQKFNNLDLDARYREYSARVAAAHSNGDGFRIVAAFLSGLQDSHTYFVPPQHAARVEPGYRLALVGDSCFVTRVRPGTDAASKLRPGDQVLKLDGYDVNRADFHDMQYYFLVLAPQSGF